MRTRLCFCLAASCLMLSGLVARAADTHEGTVVSVEPGIGSADGKLVMTDKDGKGEHTHMISSSTRVMRDDKTVKLGELKKGDSIKVTMSDGKVTELAANKEAVSGNKSENDMPRGFDKLNLTSEQKEKIKSICGECDSERQTAWRDFGEHYREAIAIEASMLAAIEDHLSDAQRKHIRDQRQRISRGRNDSSDSKNANSNENSKSNANDNANSKENKSNRANARNDQNRGVVEEITIIGVNLSPDQETAAEGVRGSYVDRLRKLNGELEELHARLVAMETNRLLKIEDVLTKEQRQQLRKSHQSIHHNETRSSNNAGQSSTTK